MPPGLDRTYRCPTSPARTAMPNRGSPATASTCSRSSPCYHRQPARHQRDPAFQRPMPRRLNLRRLGEDSKLDLNKKRHVISKRVSIFCCISYFFAEQRETKPRAAKESHRENKNTSLGTASPSITVGLTYLFPQTRSASISFLNGIRQTAEWH